MRRSSSIARTSRRYLRSLLLPYLMLGMVATLSLVGPAIAGLSAQAQLGRQIFFDPALSASGRLACSSCHSPTQAYGPPDGAAVQLGGLARDRQGSRAVPSLRYVLNRTPVWSKPFIASSTERLLEGEEPPAGGFGWDGRFNTLEAQAAFSLLAPNEMANKGPEDVVRKLRLAPYANEFRRVFGEAIFTQPQQAFARAREALAHFELEDPSFHPYSSRYDDYLEGRATLTAPERRGVALFEDPRGGNCAACHPDRKGADGSHPLFTDFQFEALGVPRNPEIAANAKPGYYDEGLCGPLRTDQAGQMSECGLFKTPGLRNVATRRVFFHNGRFHTLKEALQFYVRRDTHPAQWYPSAGGIVDKFDDLPRERRGNVDVTDAPLTRTAGQEPLWNDAQIDDVIAFLETLTDRDVRPAAR
ncbi:MAG TPA: cytochrome c peroxidase [Steroidobacteraceae bacterium]|nr:cytochrome c peroxidase [Steroidobacteraceae bacterium]